MSALMTSSIKNSEYVQGKDFVAEVSRTNRIKSATIKVEEGAVLVVVPKDLSSARISKLLKEKHRWIKEKINLHRGSLPATNKQYVSGEAFSYLGRNYRLKVNKGFYSPAKLSNGRFAITLREGDSNPQMIKDSLAYWYKHHAEIKLKSKAKRYAERVGVKYSSIGIKSYKSRWGSCSVNGEIKFNWKIIIAPNRIVDYVVVHELCHLIHHDHSTKFWKEVERAMPDFAECKEWLKDNGLFLEV